MKAEQTDYRLGIGKTDITPPFALPLAGFASRSGDYIGVSRRLYARAWLFVQEDAAGTMRKALLVQGDLIWWPAAGPLETFGRKLREKWDIDPDRMIFHASHTHGSPQTIDRFTPLIGHYRQDYVDFLERQVEQAVAEAHANVEPVTMEKGVGTCGGISINRRKQPVNGKVVTGPNPHGPNDAEVTVVRFATEAHRTKGLLFHFTCHPTTRNDNWVTSDYCGAAMERLDRELGEGVSCFMQGCCGDIRPSLYDENGFYGGDDSDVARSGEQLAGVVLDMLQSPLTPLTPAEITGWTVQAELPFQHIPSAEELLPGDEDTRLQAAWKRQLLSDPGLLKPGASLQFHLLRISDELAFLAMNGEVVVDYGLRVKRLSRGNVLPLGYSNGMVGYIPTAQQIVEGGYESKDSLYVFGFPSPFALEIEEVIHKRIHELLSLLDSGESEAEIANKRLGR